MQPSEGVSDILSAEGLSDVPTSPSSELGHDYERLLSYATQKRYAKIAHKQLAVVEPNKEEDVPISDNATTTTSQFPACDIKIRAQVFSVLDQSASFEHSTVCEHSVSDDNEHSVSDDNEHSVKSWNSYIPKESVHKMYKCKRKAKKRNAKTKPVREKKKWIPVNLDYFSFDFSLLPTRFSSVDEAQAREMDEVYKMLNQEGWMDENGTIYSVQEEQSEVEEDRKDNESAENSDNVIVAVVGQNKNKLVEKDVIGYRYVINYDPKDYDTTAELPRWRYDPHLHCSNFSCFDDSCFEDRLEACQSLELEQHDHLRIKKKWHTMRASRQIKTKHCQALCNNPHNQKLFIHHRLYKAMQQKVLTYRRKIIPSMKQIEKAKGLTTEDILKIKIASVAVNTGSRLEYQSPFTIRELHSPSYDDDHEYPYTGSNSSTDDDDDPYTGSNSSTDDDDDDPYTGSNSSTDDDDDPYYTGSYRSIDDDDEYPIAQPATINADNFDGDLDADMFNLLMQLQTRDVTPEDYDLLLRLDERVEPKSVSAQQMETFKRDTVTAELAGELCCVCSDAYEIGEQRMFLPCEHVFHKNCIELWLRTSTSCPLDKIELL